MSKGFASSYRIVLLASGLGVCFAGVAVRLVWLHVIARDELLPSIAKARYQMIADIARRGDILDCNGKFLATSRSTIEVAVDPSALLDTDAERRKWPQLAAILGLPELELRRIFTTKFRSAAPANPAPAASAAPATVSLVFNLDPAKSAPPAATGALGLVEHADAEAGAEIDGEPEADGRKPIRWVKLADDVSPEKWAQIRQLELHGLCAPVANFRRVYPNDRLAAHIIGYVDHEGRPVAGMEFYTDFYLRGQNGWRIGERDGRRNELAQFRSREVPRADGYSVELTLDATVQDVIEQELDYLAKKFQPEKATIIVSDPRTGFIYGLANYPSFNLNEYNQVPKADEAAMKNVAVADIYDPGSVFKIVPAAAALEEGLVTPDTTFNVGLDHIVYTGCKVPYRGHEIKLPGEDHHFDDPTHIPLSRVISFSSNRGAAQLGMMLGEERLYKYARAFGFGQRLGFPVGGEVSGILHPVKEWSPIDITRIPMGQSVSVTVLQMHQAMSVIANEGVLLRPQIIQQIRDASGETVYRYGRVELGRVVSVRTARQMAQMLTGVASKNGTAPGAAIPGYDVAGKTGTAQKYLPETLANGEKKLVPSKTHHVASFIGFFPAMVEPGQRQVAISIVVDDADAHAPGGVAYGAVVAAPSFKRVGEKLIPILNLQPTPPTGRLTFALEGGRR